MVMVQTNRRNALSSSSTGASPSDAVARKSHLLHRPQHSFGCSMGDDNEADARSNPYRYATALTTPRRYTNNAWTSPSPFAPISSSSKTLYTDIGTGKSGRWTQQQQPRIIQAIYALAVLSWIWQARTSAPTRVLLPTLLEQERLLSLHVSELETNWHKLRTEATTANRHIKTLQQANQALQHEFDMLQELGNTYGGEQDDEEEYYDDDESYSEESPSDETETAGVEESAPAPVVEVKDANTAPAVKRRKQHNVMKRNGQSIQSWMQHRQRSLQSRIDVLQNYVRQESTAAVLEHYGPGPHQLEFTVEFKGQSPLVQTFVVELAPLALLPHTIHYVLDMFTRGLWDNTMFLHQDDVDHVIQAAPVDATRHMLKFHQLRDIGWHNTLGWPEYSDQYKHAAYTLGFADQGPTFYINTIDNDESHGPGGQAHHTLPHDADPCWGRIVRGREVVDAMHQVEHHAMSANMQHPWASNDSSYTRIVKVELV